MTEDGDAPYRGYVVVVFGSGPAEGWCDLSQCPMHVRGPYTRHEAEQLADGLPGWMQPHILALHGDDGEFERAPA
jgi:hypothetical protein